MCSYLLLSVWRLSAALLIIWLCVLVITETVMKHKHPFFHSLLRRVWLLPFWGFDSVCAFVIQPCLSVCAAGLCLPVMLLFSLCLGVANRASLGDEKVRRNDAMMQVARVQWVSSQHALHHTTASEETANEAQQALHCTVVYCLHASQQFRAGNSVMCLAQWEHSGLFWSWWGHSFSVSVSPLCNARMSQWWNNSKTTLHTDLCDYNNKHCIDNYKEHVAIDILHVAVQN